MLLRHSVIQASHTGLLMVHWLHALLYMDAVEDRVQESYEW